MDDLKINIDYIENKVTLMRCEGFIDSVTVPLIEKKIQESIQKGIFQMVVDLGLVNYVSSAGWGVFVSEIKDIRAKQGDLVLTGMAPEVYDVYELMEFSSILKSFDSLGDAFANFGVKGPQDANLLDPSKGMQKGQQPLSGASKPPDTSKTAPASDDKPKKSFFGFKR